MVGLVLYFGFLIGSGLTLILIICGVAAAIRYGRHSRAELLRAGAILALGVAVGVYTWGMGHVLLAVMNAEDGGTGSSPLLPCRGEAAPEMVSQVVDYRVGWVPLRFQCLPADGGSYTTSAVPWYVNPVAWTFGVAGVAGLVAPAVSARRSSRPAGKAGTRSTD
ncbi:MULTISPECIES: hypothetical protein [Thermomonospora]|uniref:Uncharacterized protein n=1 Tax=Thermomonospora curvata (strain ATCC 19995 / DSM 43183 / JCM 3096 / KCTC 9072 / NBRC 15933 / NCIMB 10081 / Henssen B9) TaxID=471852 RepID=D1A4S2_THECD|nr:MULTISPECIES: hypothetical protein [Thermomonospora]ACY98091.1 hypothetical protein Tcur_2530 [Thermomonospora curvata DSM 43183]PKK14360.1 MAG: hypothetical protein BUE48_012380 [Thermomonospora sp. CIF 1]